MSCDVLQQETTTTRLWLINFFLFVTLKTLNLLKDATENLKKMYLTMTADVNKPVTFYERILMNKKQKLSKKNPVLSFMNKKNNHILLVLLILYV